MFSSTEAPVTVLEPPALQEAPDLVLARFCRERPTIRLLVSPTFRSLRGHIYDMTANRITVLCYRALPPGSRVAIQWHFGPPPRWRTLLARVTRAASLPGDVWAVSCAFEPPLTADDLVGVVPTL
jgi:hypothetical protein